MSMESIKVEKVEDWGSVKHEPELMQAPDVASPLAGSSDECYEVGTEMSIPAYSYEVPVIQELKLVPECVKQEEVKEEWCGVRERDERAGPYAGHAVKHELVLGPELLQVTDVPFPLKGTSGEPRTASQALLAEAKSSKSSGDCLPCSESRGKQLVVKLVRISDDMHPDTRTVKLVDQSTLTPRRRRVKKEGSPRHKHNQIHTVVECHRCKVCDRRFSTSGRLKIHSQFHAEESYTCDICNEQFVSSWKFVSHKIIHRGEKPYPCDLCNEMFSALSSLLRHKRVHTAGKRRKRSLLRTI